MHHEKDSKEWGAAPTLDKGSRSRSARPLNRILAIGMMAIIVISALAVINLSQAPIENDDESTAATSQVGPRETTYTISNFFNTNLKSTDYSELGRHTGSAGMNSWFDLRVAYNEYILRDTYPMALAYDPYSTMHTPATRLGYVIVAPYHVQIDAKNVTECNTTYYDSTNNGDILYTPMRNSTAISGGWVNMSLFMDYLTTQEMFDIYDRFSTHYANSYYGVPARQTPLSGLDDGYWHELQGYFDFNRQAAIKYLNLSGVGDLRDEWNTTTSNSARYNDIESDWLDGQMADGVGATPLTPGGDFDIYTAYDWNNDVRLLRNILDWQNSTADSIRVRIWAVSWGNDVLIPRYLENHTVLSFLQTWNKNFYVNATIGPEKSDFEISADAWYNINAWKDGDYGAGWTFESEHLDWTFNKAMHDTYPSPFNVYYPDAERPTYSPGTTQYGTNCSYYVAPMIMNLSAGEKMIIKLPSIDILGYAPYVGANDTIAFANKRAEINSSAYWGEMVLGKDSNPSMVSYYDPATKTITINGPFDGWAVRKPNGGNASLIEEGSPSYSFGVSRVSDYTVEILNDSWQPVASPMTTIVYNLRMIAKNLTGATITDWNGTVDLSASGITGSTATLGASSHTFIPADNGNWTTTIVFNDPDTFYVNATDQNYSLDVKGTSGSVIVVLIPEFSMMLLPILGMLALFFIFRTRKRRTEE